MVRAAGGATHQLRWWCVRIRRQLVALLVLQHLGREACEDELRAGSSGRAGRRLEQRKRGVFDAHLAARERGPARRSACGGVLDGGPHGGGGGGGVELPCACGRA
jgi:hypothetical protein